MGNMLPCLVQGSTLPAMSPKQRIGSVKLLVKALSKMKKRRCVDKAKIAGAGKSAPAVAEAAAAAGGVKQEEVEEKSNCKPSSDPRLVSLRRAAHGRRGGGAGDGKGVVRVKVVLTKEEAARLLSLTVGGQKSAAQVVAEIKRMEARRAAIGAAPEAWRPALESIPEES